MNLHGDRMRVVIFMSCILILCSVCAPCKAGCSGMPQKDGVLPPFQLPAPISDDDQKYLGVKGPTFQLKDIQCQVLLVEILGAYCPLCYQQAPLFSKLFARLAKRNLGDKVKMLGVAIGATSMEVEQLKKNGSYQFPLVQDQSFAVHKLLGEPRTPFTMLIGKEGRILYAHLGVIDDVDAFYQVIQDLVK
jgi:peroxiredoxin